MTDRPAVVFSSELVAAATRAADAFLVDGPWHPDVLTYTTLVAERLGPDVSVGQVLRTVCDQLAQLGGRCGYVSDLLRADRELTSLRWHLITGGAASLLLDATEPRYLEALSSGSVAAQRDAVEFRYRLCADAADQLRRRDLDRPHWWDRLAAFSLHRADLVRTATARAGFLPVPKRRTR